MMNKKMPVWKPARGRWRHFRYPQRKCISSTRRRLIGVELKWWSCKEISLGVRLIDCDRAFITEKLRPDRYCQLRGWKRNSWARLSVKCMQKLKPCSLGDLADERGKWVVQKCTQARSWWVWLQGRKLLVIEGPLKKWKMFVHMSSNKDEK